NGRYREAYSDCAGHFLATADPGFIAVGESSVLSEGLPYGFSVAFCLKGCLIADFHARRLQGCDGELPIPFIGNSAGAIVFEHNPFHGLSRAQRFIGEAVVVSLIQSSREVSRKSAEPPQHVRP